jgi:transglutaminase-like putative cysteine protease
MNFVNYRIVHRTSYAYGNSILEGTHLLRLQPRDTLSQKCLSFSLNVLPESTPSFAFTDYYGNQCNHLIIDQSHQKFIATSESRVSVSMPFWPEPEETPAWETVKFQMATDRGNQALEAMEFIYDSPLIEINKEVLLFAQDSFTPGRPILAAGKDLTERIFHEFIFDPVATDVATPVGNVLGRKRGVCQDFAQLAIACFRSIGLPARYISGYLETQPPLGAPKLVGADASHAWMAFYCPGIGWIELDPTNGCIPTLHHIRIGWGRDYSDIAPIVGMIQGTGSHTLDVSVDVTAEPPFGTH